MDADKRMIMYSDFFSFILRCLYDVMTWEANGRDVGYDDTIVQKNLCYGSYG